MITLDTTSLETKDGAAPTWTKVLVIGGVTRLPQRVGMALDSSISCACV